MKFLLNVLAVCCLVTVIGCSTSESTSASPAALAECGVNCEQACCAKAAAPSCCKDGKTCADCQAKIDANFGAVSDATQCDKSKCGKLGQCPKAGNTSPGALRDCASTCAGKKCPMTGKKIDG